MVWDRIFAAAYDPIQSRAERGWMGRMRAELLLDLDGVVLEIGAGTGANLPHYPEAVERVTVTEPSPPMRDRLGPKIARAVPSIEVVPTSGESLPFDDDEFDHVVGTLVLCTVDDVESTLREVRRVLMPGGTYWFIEHGGADGGRRGAWQRRLEPMWRRVSCGCHLTRDACASLARAGFDVDAQSFDPPGVPDFLRPFTTGVATS